LALEEAEKEGEGERDEKECEGDDEKVKAIGDEGEGDETMKEKAVRIPDSEEVKSFSTNAVKLPPIANPPMEVGTDLSPVRSLYIQQIEEINDDEDKRSDDEIFAN
jgi:hypothetical protein